MSDQIPTQEITFAPHNITACFPSMERARTAVEALEEGGIGGSSISLLGRAAEAAADRTDTAAVDEKIIQEGMKSTLGGAVVGTGIGAVAGFVAGAVVFGVPGIGPTVAAGLWALTIGGGVAGGGVGFVAGAMVRMKQSQAWALTLSDVGEGYVVVGVHTDDRQEYDHAAEILDGTAPDRIRRFGQDGEPLQA